MLASSTTHDNARITAPDASIHSKSDRRHTCFHQRIVLYEVQGRWEALLLALPQGELLVTSSLSPASDVLVDSDKLEAARLK